jgi:hypothetical protein
MKIISSRNYNWFTKKNKGITAFDVEKEKTAHTFVTRNEYHAHW